MEDEAVWQVPGEQAGDAVLSALDLVQEGIDKLRQASLWARSDTQAVDGVRRVYELMAAFDAARLSLVKDLDDRPGAVAGAPAGRGAFTFLTQGLRVGRGQAAADVRAARAVDAETGSLPRLGVALAAGQVHRGHVDAAARVLEHLPGKVLNTVHPGTGETAIGWLDGFLTEQATVAGPGTTEALAQHALRVLAPDTADRYDERAQERRYLSAAVDGTGMTLLRGQLDPACGAVVRAALEHFARPATGSGVGTGVDADGEPVTVVDERTRGQRLHDALVEVASTAMAAAASGGPLAGGVPVHVAVDATPAQVAAARAATPATPDPDAEAEPDAEPDEMPTAPTAPTGAGAAWVHGLGPVSAGTFGRLLCEAVLTPVIRDTNGAVLYLGRSTRLASAAQRKALAIRDAGCCVPGCGIPAAGCEAHHVIWWRHGGTTDITNLALVCQRHHTAIHTGVWQLVMRDGVPWAIPPPWVDPDRRPIRNTTFTARQQLTRRLDEIRRDLDEDTG